MPDISHTRQELATFAHNCWLKRLGHFLGLGEHHANGSVYFSADVVDTMLRDAGCYDDMTDAEKEEATDEANGIIDLARKTFYSVPAAARLGVALQQGPVTLTEATVIVLDVAGLQRRELSREAWYYWRKKCLRLIDSLTFVGALCVYEFKNDDGELVYDLLREEQGDGSGTRSSNAIVERGGKDSSGDSG